MCTLGGVDDFKQLGEVLMLDSAHKSERNKEEGTVAVASPHFERCSDIDFNM
jgi:hypothetical protein